MGTPYASVLDRLQDDLVLRQLSPHTVSSYLTHVRLFLTWAARPVDALNTDDIRRFLVFLVRDQQLAPGTVNVYSAAIRFFFAVTLNRSLNYLQIPCQKLPATLPVVLSRTDIGALLTQTTHFKHRAWLTLLYGSGLRVSEAAAVKTSHIDSTAMRVFVQGGKGHKDRYTLLSKAALEALRAYWQRDRPRHPDGWLFLGPGPSGHVSASSIQQAYQHAVAAVLLDRPGSVHTLRHRFATHLLEDGATLLQIKELLGHRSIPSTTVYLHLANLTAGLRSPLDAGSAEVTSNVR
ncbi:MAG: tyrosine-type recombinase/integrase [Thermaerobacter sp.]|nr:tyrosine-type recombinase/integrase [Thermaerobacter sp.]